MHSKHHKYIKTKGKVRGREIGEEKCREIKGIRQKKENGDRDIRTRGWTAEKKGSTLSFKGADWKQFRITYFKKNNIGNFMAALLKLNTIITSYFGQDRNEMGSFRSELWNTFLLIHTLLSLKLKLYSINHFISSWAILSNITELCVAH